MIPDMQKYLAKQRTALEAIAQWLTGSPAEYVALRDRPANSVQVEIHVDGAAKWALKGHFEDEWMVSEMLFRHLVAESAKKLAEWERTRQRRDPQIRMEKA